jgi:hypothetical protein
LVAASVALLLIVPVPTDPVPVSAVPLVESRTMGADVTLLDEDEVELREALGSVSIARPDEGTPVPAEIPVPE